MRTRKIQTLFSLYGAFSVCIVGVCLQTACEKRFVEEETNKNRCVLTIDQSPEIRGFKLGMNQADIESRFEGLKIPTPTEYGTSRIQITPQPAQFHQKDSGVRQGGLGSDNSSVYVSIGRFSDLADIKIINLYFREQRLSSYRIFYDSEVTWKSVDDVAKHFASTLNLPGEWGRVSPREPALSCGEFVVMVGLENFSAFSGGTDPYIDIQSLSGISASANEITNRAEKLKQDEEKKRDNFKP